MYLLILFLPFVSFLVLGLFGRFFFFYHLIIISISCIFLTFLITLFAFYEVFIGQSICYLPVYDWINLNTLKVSWAFLFDNISSVMFIIVLFISLLVHYYSVEYMTYDPFIIRFISYLSLFTFFMLILLSASNYVQLFLGWEGVGLSSYLLINFWFTRIQANKAAIKAIILNRFGDIGIYLAIIIILYNFGTTDFLVLTGLVSQLSGEITVSFNLIVVCLFIGAMGKSAQFGLHTWLPDAMEGPTPVSALIHAATMVTAGIFVLIRSNFFLEKTPVVLLYIALIGSLTAFFAGSIGGFQYDLKKVIAYSTCSQLGYMVFICGLSNYGVSLFHLFNHAFFKALLFLGAGSVIHALYDEQDMRRMGGLQKILPVTYISIFIGSVTLIGIPFLSGFYSKDVILEYAFIHNTPVAFLGYIICSIAIIYTTIYSLRLLYLTFYNGCNFQKLMPSESGNIILSVLAILSVISLVIGFIFKDIFLSGWLIPSNTEQFFNSEFLNIWSKHLPLFCIFIGFCLWVVSLFCQLPNSLYHFFNQKWYIDLFYNKCVVSSVMFFGYHITFKLIDRGLIEHFGPFGISQSYRFIEFIQRLFSGYIYHSIFLIIFFFICIFYFIYVLSFTMSTFFFLSLIIVLLVLTI